LETVETVRKTLLGRLAHADLLPEERRRLMAALFYSGKKDRLARFWILMFFSVVIASYGLIADSTAVVIGSMLLAPLMTPIMGFAASLVMVWGRRMGESSLLILMASAFAVGLAWVITRLSPDVLLSPLPDEVLGRTAPNLNDLFIALAAGGAGAFATVREDVSASLPGVAIAVALVPPISTVGIVLGAGKYDLAWGALLLFITNIAGIILSASLVLLVTGFVPRMRITQLGRRLFAGLVVAVIAVLLVAIPLYKAMSAAVRKAQISSSVEKSVNAWIGDRPMAVRDKRIGSDSVQLVLMGLEDPPEIGQLAQALEDDLGRPVDVDVVWFTGEERSDHRHEQSGRDESDIPLIPGV
jgi:uncharacterized hydrophobic protein (TIGR00271 family)